MEILIKKGSSVPLMAHEGEDVGFDICATEEPTIFGESIDTAYNGRLWRRIDNIQYKTNLFFSPQPEFLIRKVNKGLDKEVNEWITVNYHTHIFARSSISRTGLMLSTGVSTIDRGYKNELIINFRYLVQPEDLVIDQNQILCKINQEKIYHANEKICQLVVFPTTYAKFVEVNKLPESKRDLKGFGSTGK